MAANVNELRGECAVVCPHDSCDIDDEVRFVEYKFFKGNKMDNATVNEPDAPKKDWWLHLLEDIANKKSGETVTVTLDLKRSIWIAKKIAEGEKWSDVQEKWWKESDGYRQEPTEVSNG